MGFRGGQFLASLCANLQTFFSVDPVGPLAVVDHAFSPQHVMQHRMVVAWIMRSQRLEVRPQFGNVVAFGSIPGGTTKACQPTSSAFTHSASLEMVHGPSPLLSHYHFASMSWLSVALSNFASVNSRYSLAFSCLLYSACTL